MPRKPAKPKTPVAPAVKESLTTETPPALPDEREAQRVEARFVEIGRSHGDVTEKRLRDLYFIWKNPINAEGKIQRLRGDEIKELQKHGIIQTEIQETGELGSGVACAEYIKKTRGYACNKDFITKWTNGKMRPPVGNKRFPMADAAGRRKQSEVDAWCDVSLPGGTGEISAGALNKIDPHTRKAEADAKVAEMESAEMERATSGKWILFAIVKSYVNGMGARACAAYDRAIEDRDGLRKIVREVAARCGATEEFILRLDAELAREFVTANDNLKAEFKRTQVEAQKHFEQQRKEQLKAT